MGAPFRKKGTYCGWPVRALIDTNDRQALQMSLYARLSRSRFGAEFVLWADKNEPMFVVGRTRTLDPGAK